MRSKGSSLPSAATAVVLLFLAAVANAAGAVIVAAAGNDEADASGFYPAGLPTAITVAASTPSDSQASFSNWGSKIDVAAPGVDVLSLRAAGTAIGPLVGSEYVRADGTSMACPHVAGLAALVLSSQPAYSNEQVRQALRLSAVDLGSSGFDLDFGYGRIDATGALGVSAVLETKILSPVDGAAVSAPTPVLGLARGQGFVGYRLEYGAGETPGSWSTISEGSSPVDGESLGTFDPTALSDGALRGAPRGD